MQNLVMVLSFELLSESHWNEIIMVIFTGDLY